MILSKVLNIFSLSSEMFFYDEGKILHISGAVKFSIETNFWRRTLFKDKVSSTLIDFLKRSVMSLLDKNLMDLLSKLIGVLEK